MDALRDKPESEIERMLKYWARGTAPARGGGRDRTGLTDPSYTPAGPLCVP